MPQPAIANADLKKYKREFAHTYSFGVFPTLELLEHRHQHVLKVLLNSRGEQNEGVQKIRRICRERNIAAEVNDKLVERLAPNENSYAIGILSKYESKLNTGESHVVLVNPSDMGNLGTIIRSMIGFGITNLGIVKPGVDIFDPRVIRSSMGALLQLSFEYFDTFDLYTTSYPNGLYPFMTDGHTSLSQVRFQTPFTLVFGNEGAGLPDHYRTLGTSITIPHTTHIDSLNLTIAVGIALYEATREAFR
jgi:TrmH family RNA methyltransferase